MCLTPPMHDLLGWMESLMGCLLSLMEPRADMAGAPTERFTEGSQGKIQWAPTDPCPMLPPSTHPYHPPAFSTRRGLSLTPMESHTSHHSSKVVSVFFPIPSIVLDNVLSKQHNNFNFIKIPLDQTADDSPLLSASCPTTPEKGDRFDAPSGSPSPGRANTSVIERQHVGSARHTAPSSYLPFQAQRDLRPPFPRRRQPLPSPPQVPRRGFRHGFARHRPYEVTDIKWSPSQAWVMPQCSPLHPHSSKLAANHV
ncbi:hypothetical protein QBC39DRAFT_184809 [Podospora conica]|nr:hypothetical protein QBC39DRAFT_184809 [Schizothecium conicum]